MNETALLAAAVFAGGGIGMFYFMGLWLTVRRLENSAHPALLTLGSFLGRTAAAVFLFYLLVRGGHWERGLAALVGFIISRLILVRVQKNRARVRAPSTPGGKA
jgi:F1F0 ATPase subunit 2